MIRVLSENKEGRNRILTSFFFFFFVLSFPNLKNNQLRLDDL